MKKIIPTLFFFLLPATFSFAQSNFWHQTNGPARTSCYAIYFLSNDHILAGTLEKGIFRSTDNGDTWIQTSLTDATVNCFIVDPLFGVIYAGADDGIYMSVDGNNWIHTQDFERVMSFTIDSFGRIYAGCLGTGVWTKTGTDTSWTWIGLDHMFLRSLGIFVNYLFAGCAGAGVWRTSNNGLSWEPVNNGLNHLEVHDLIINDMGYIFISTEYGGVYRSTDFGAHWMQMNNGLSFTNSVWSPVINSNRHIFVGTDGQRGVYRSTDFGSSWNLAGLSNNDIITIGINSNDQIFAGSVYDKLFRSTDNGNNWSLVGLPDTHVLSLACKSNGLIFAGTKDYGIYCSTNNGEEWKHQILDREEDVNAIKINSYGFIYVGTAGAGIFCSTNNGEDWTKASFFVLGNDSINCIGINSSGHIFAGTDGYGIYKTTNYGLEWNQVNNGLTNLHIRCITISSDDKIFIGTQDDGIFYSSNGGSYWTQINNGISNQNVKTLAINPINGNIFAGTWGDGVYRSTDNGMSWEKVNTGLSNHYIYSIVINSDGYIFTSSHGGKVYRSVDNGNSWVQISSGLINISDVYCLSIDVNNFLYSGTSGSGVYRSVHQITSVQDTLTIPGSFILYQNFPNPFNSITKIRYIIPADEKQEPGKVSLVVYDVLGNEVITLVNEEKTAGNYIVDFNASGLSSGVYFYQLRAGSFVETKKMILLK